MFEASLWKDGQLDEHSKVDVVKKKLLILQFLMEDLIAKLITIAKKFSQHTSYKTKIKKRQKTKPRNKKELKVKYFNKFLNNTSLKGSETDSIIRIKNKIPIEEPKKELKTTQIGLNTNYPVGEIKRHKEKPLLKEMLLIKNKNFYSSMGNTLVVW